jgi:Uma2 family endonuclease
MLGLDMASRLQVSPGEYLSTSFDGTDREYVRGEIVERSMPDNFHSEMQGKLIYRFWQLHDSHRLFVRPELRLRLAPDLYRIPDVSVFAGEKPKERVPSHPPLVAIEIISPDDRFAEVVEKLAEYEKWGVPHIWVIDPDHRTLALYEAGTLRTVTQLTLPGYPLELSSELFS